MVPLPRPPLSSLITTWGLTTPTLPRTSRRDGGHGCWDHAGGVVSVGAGKGAEVLDDLWVWGGRARLAEGHQLTQPLRCQVLDNNNNNKQQTNKQSNNNNNNKQ